MYTYCICWGTAAPAPMIKLPLTSSLFSYSVVLVRCFNFSSERLRVFKRHFPADRPSPEEIKGRKSHAVKVLLFSVVHFLHVTPFQCCGSRTEPYAEMHCRLLLKVYRSSFRQNTKKVIASLSSDVS